MSPARFQVVWTEGAARDLTDIAVWIARESPADARRLLKRIRNRSRTLATTPSRCRVVPELVEFGIHQFRELITRPYRLVYRVQADRVFVLAVLDSRRDLEDVLLERLVRNSPGVPGVF